MKARYFSALMLALTGACADPVEVKTRQLMVAGEVSLAKTSVFQFDPVFLAFGVHSTLAASQEVELPLSLVEVQKQISGNWVDQPIHQPTNLPDDAFSLPPFILPAGGSHWIEMPLWDSRVLESPGWYRVRFTFRHSDISAPTMTAVQSPWQMLTVASQAANVAAMQADGVRALYDQMLVSGFDQSVGPGSMIVDLDETLVTPLQAANLSADLRTFAGLIVAHRRLNAAEEQFLGAAQTKALNAAAAALAGLSSESYGGKVGGLGAHLIYARAMTDWYRAKTVRQFDQATTLFRTITTRFPAASSARKRESLEWLREQRFGG